MNGQRESDIHREIDREKREKGRRGEKDKEKTRESKRNQLMCYRRNVSGQRNAKRVISQTPAKPT